MSQYRIFYSFSLKKAQIICICHFFVVPLHAFSKKRGKWRSPVAQRSGGPEVACSNHVFPTKNSFGCFFVEVRIRSTRVLILLRSNDYCEVSQFSNHVFPTKNSFGCFFVEVRIRSTRVLILLRSNDYCEVSQFSNHVFPTRELRFSFFILSAARGCSPRLRSLFVPAAVLPASLRYVGSGPRTSPLHPNRQSR